MNITSQRLATAAALPALHARALGQATKAVVEIAGIRDDDRQDRRFIARPMREIQASRNDTARRSRSGGKQSPSPSVDKDDIAEAPGVGRPDATARTLVGASAAFVAQRLAQEILPEPESAEVARVRLGFEAYRDTLAQGVSVIGPANAEGVVI